MKLVDRHILTVVSLVLAGSAVSATEHGDAVKLGNAAYYNQDYTTALEHYHIAETAIPESTELDYNMGGALYNQGKYEEAVDKFTRALNSPEIDLEAQAHYNLGSTYYRMNDYENAIKSFQNALEIDPDDMDAKFNLELARKMLKEQIKPEQQEQQQQQQQEQEQQEKQEQDQQDQDQQDQQNQDQQEQQSQPSPQEEQEMSKEDAERILNALRDDEQDIQKKVRRHRASGAYQGKDW